VRAGTAQPNPVLALAVSSMNDVFNTQADTQAAWLNRIPTAAWALMILIAIFSNTLLGYRDRSSGSLALLVLPVIASIAFFLIADIDSPYSGVISVVPHNLTSTSEAMKP
jgi:peptidoglycan/LPS O-acetylase OafA/YrhL